jgi:hypothetical protein
MAWPPGWKAACHARHCHATAQELLQSNNRDIAHADDNTLQIGHIASANDNRKWPHPRRGRITWPGRTFDFFFGAAQKTRNLKIIASIGSALPGHRPSPFACLLTE